MRAFDSHDYERAYREALPLAEEGDEEARRIAASAKKMMELKRLADDRLAATGPIDLRDHDGRYRVERSAADEERFARARRLDQEGDDAAAFREWLPLAEAGDAEAQYEIALLYWLGHGVTEDREKAESYLLQSARQGYGRAQGYLAEFRNPFGASEDETVQRDSALWAMRAAANGEAWGYAGLSHAYCHGEGMDKNPVLADIWLYMIYPAKEDFLRRYCNVAVELPTPYYEAIAERAEAMRKAYDIPMAFEGNSAEEPSGSAAQP